MADLKAAQKEPENQLFDEIDKVHAGMLGVAGSGAMQPMAPELDRATKTIWFFTRKDSDLAQAASRSGTGGVFVLVGKDHDYHACLSGSLEERLDPAIRDRFWSSVVEAWFDGKDDPQMTMLAMRLERGHVWVSTDSVLKFGWEIARAQLNEHEPDVGISLPIEF